jgi:uncharacterized protein YkwD
VGWGARIRRGDHSRTSIAAILAVLGAVAIPCAPAAQAKHKPPRRHRPAPAGSTTGPAPRPGHGASGSAGAGTVPATCVDTDLDPTPENLDRVSAALRCLVNQARVQAGDEPLGPAAQLSSAGAQYAQRMATEHFFGHVSPEGGTVEDRIRASGYLDHQYHWGLGEDLAWGTLENARPGAIFAALMASDAHRTVLLTRAFRDIGIGVTPAPPQDTGQPGATYALEFAWTSSPAG